MTRTRKSVKGSSVGAHRVAEMAGVSVATTYLALRDDRRIAKTTRSRIQAAARELGYRPSASARALKQGRSNAVGLIFADPITPMRNLLRVYADAIEALHDGFSNRQYHMSLSKQVADEKGDAAPFILQEILAAGYLVIGQPPSALSHQLRRQDAPVVLLDAVGRDGFTSIYLDECRAAELAVEHLVSLGHRRIALVMGLSPDEKYISHRAWEFPRGYARAMANAGLVPMPSWDERLPWAEHMQALFDNGDAPTAVIVYDDYMAWQTFGLLAGNGLKCPQDVSVVALRGSGHVAESGGMGFPSSLTMIDSRQQQMGSEAARLLVSCISQQDASQMQSSVIAPDMRAGNSTAPVQSGANG